MALKKSLSPEDYSTDAISAITSQEESTEADENRDKEQALDVQESSAITDDELKKELKRFLIPKIRSASYRWGERSRAIKNARVERGRYKCAMCGNRELKNGEFVLDHINPVVDLDGWDQSWDTYITRMFVKAEGFQVLCKTPCHEMKTDAEVQLRKLRREAKKKLAK
jgi:hypothetical protein